MKKFKKLFKLIPVFCIAFVSGLSAVLSYDHELKPVKADSTSAPLYVESFSTNVSAVSGTSPNYNVSFRNFGSFGYYFNIDSEGTTYFLNIQIAFDNFVHQYYGDLSMTSGATISHEVPSNASNFKVYFSYLNAISKDSSRIFDCQVQFMISIDGGSLQVLGGSPGYFNYKFRQYNPTPTGYSYMKAFPSGSSPILIMDMTYQRTVDDGAYMEGYNQGYLDGYNIGYTDGQSNGQANGYRSGFADGSASREQDITNAYNNGYSAGYENGSTANHTVATIFSGILQVGMLPINVMLAMFNFQILGINLSAFVSALLTVCLTVIVIRTITGKGGNND